MNKIHEVTKDNLKNDIPEFDSGDTVAVNVRVREGNKERVQKYEGVVVGRRGGKGLDASFTVRKVTNGVGVERIFPLHSPMLASIDIKRRGKVRRSKLNYLKNVTGVELAKNVEFIEDVIITAKLGQHLRPPPDGGSYVGFIFSRGNSQKTVIQALRTAHAVLSFEVVPHLEVKSQLRI